MARLKRQRQPSNSASNDVAAMRCCIKHRLSRIQQPTTCSALLEGQVLRDLQVVGLQRVGSHLQAATRFNQFSHVTSTTHMNLAV